MYPNPTHSSLYLTCPKGTIRIVNSLGQEVYTEIAIFAVVDKEISLSQLPQGLYYVQLQGENGVFTTKFFKE